MPKSATNSNHNEDSDNEFSSANENSNLSELNPTLLVNSTGLRTASQTSTIPTQFNQNSSSSTSSLQNHSGNTSTNNSQTSHKEHKDKRQRFSHQSFSKNIYIGTKNAEKWDNLRNLFQFKNDVEFVSFLLNSAEKEALSNPNGFKLPVFQKDNTDNSEQSSSSMFLHKQTPTPLLPQQQPPIIVQKKIKRVQFQDNVNIINEENLTQQHELNLSISVAKHDNNAQDHSISSTIDGSVSSDESNNTTEILDCRIEEKIKNEQVEKQKMMESGRRRNSTNGSRYDEAPTPPPITSSLIEKHMSEQEDDDSEEMLDNKRKFYDVRKAPMLLDVQLHTAEGSVNQDKSVFDFKDDDDEDDFEDGRLEINSEFMIRDRKNKKPNKPKVCVACNSKHGKEICPIKNPIGCIENLIDFNDWIKDHPIIEPPKPLLMLQDEPIEDEKMFLDESIKSENEGDLDDLDDDLDDEMLDDDPDEKPDMDDPSMCNEITYSELSLPKEFEFMQSLTYPNRKMSVYTKTHIPKYTQMGPLVGEVLTEAEITDDSTMAYMFEIHDNILAKSIFFNLENKNKSNWFRYLQPAQARDQRNLTMIRMEDKIYFVSSMDINIGSELLYWSDEINSAWGKKKIDKTNCGGCNLKFDHPLHYRTHCSVFHDPGFSLTIRKYHCKICGMAVLGKENIMKHAEKLHEGKGAYQCQYCKKFFLRLNYLEMHRTYGCSANPQRARPLCDFCGRKFCQPQKLKVHIKRMHSDMAEVLRDFQCKMCSKLLGSRAALQRHSKEVHSRNSAVVSCPRCQKLFQNRSNLKIHMLTHSGVRPFKCAEGECAAAFTTKQCLQFHYKKVHGYTQEQMPKIERSVAYTFDAYSGGLKNEALDGMSRRQRKNLGESFEKATKSLPRREKEMILKDKNFLTSITDLCKNESNLNLLSSKISSILSCNLKDINEKMMEQGGGSNQIDDDGLDDDGNDFGDNESFSERSLDTKMLSQKNMNMLHKHIDDPDHMMDNSNMSGEQDLDEDCDDEDDSRQSFKMAENKRAMLESQQLDHARLKDFLMQTNPNLVISKGSKKWISDSVSHGNDMEDSDANLMTVANREFLAKLISSKLHKGPNQNARIVENSGHDEDDENSTILDVVESNNMHQHQQQETSHFSAPFSASNSNNGSNNNLMDIQPQFPSNTNSFNNHFNSLGGFYNANSSANRNLATTIPTSASLLVEAALNSVSNMIGQNMDNGDNQQMSIDNTENHQTMSDEISNNEFNSPHHMMGNVEDNMKIMKTQNFPLHLPSMAAFSNSGNNNSNLLNENIEIDVDASSTPKSREKLCSYTPSNGGDKEINSFGNQHNEPSPARTMTPDHHPNYSSNFNGQRNQHQDSPPTDGGGRQIYTEHDLISPASTPTLPRYDFSAENYRRRDKSNIEYGKSLQQHHQQQHNMAHMSSDEENSIVIAENLSVTHPNSHIVNEKIKLNSQIDLLYSNNGKYEGSNSNSSNQLNRESLNDIRLKYNEQGLDIQEFRNTVVNENVVGNASGPDYHGLDMSSRSGIGYHAHNFPASSNISFNRYQHHIYDILTDRDQQLPQNTQQQDHHSFQLQQQHQQIQHLLQDHISQEQDSDQISSGVDLSRTSNYIVPPSPTPTPHLPYSHSHSEMLRMVSLDLSSGTSGASPGMVGSNNAHHVRHHSSFLPHATNREIPEHHRFLSSADQRLLVDPTAHLLLEQNNRLLNSENSRLLEQSRLLSESSSNRHVVSPRGFGAYHHPHPQHSHHQVSSSNYHHHHAAVKQTLAPATNQHSSNYHPFSASYY